MQWEVGWSKGPDASVQEGREERSIVAAGAELWRGGVGARGKVERCYCAGLRSGAVATAEERLDDDFHALPDGAHGGDDFFFAGRSK